MNTRQESKKMRISLITFSVVGITYIVSALHCPAYANENRVNLGERVAEETGIDARVELQQELTEIIGDEELDNLQNLLETISGVENSDLQRRLLETVNNLDVEDAKDVQNLLETIGELENNELQEQLLEAIQAADDLEDRFINVIATVSQGGTLEAIAGQVFLENRKPRELLNEVNITLDGGGILDAVDIDNLDEDETVNGTELKIDFETVQGDEPDFEVGNNLSESEIISLVRAFTEGIGIQERDRVTATAFREEEATDPNDGTVRSVIATEVELAPGQSFTDNTKNKDAEVLISTDTRTFNDNNFDGDEFDVLSELSIERDDGNDLLAPNENLEVELAQEIENADFDQASSIISLVRAFGDGGEQEQARISGASLVDDERDNNDLLSVAAGEVELARGQLLDTQNGTLVTVTSDLQDSNSTVRVEGLDIDYFIDNDSLSLEAAIAAKVENNNFTRPSDIISLVNAITNERERDRSFQELNERNVGLE